MMRVHQTTVSVTYISFYSVLLYYLPATARNLHPVGSSSLAFIQLVNETCALQRTVRGMPTGDIADALGK